MRLEAGIKVESIQKGHDLLQNLERDAKESAYSSVYDNAQTLRVVLSSVPDFNALAEMLERLESLSKAASEGRLDSESKLNVIFMSVVSALRHALAHLGLETRTAKMLPKIIQDINRLMANLEKKAAAVPRVQAPIALDGYLESFLGGEDSSVAKILECAQLAVSMARASKPGFDLDELFRYVHTVKGNAMALGLEEIASIAHDFEDDLLALRGRETLSLTTAQELLWAAEWLKEVFQKSRNNFIERKNANAAAPIEKAKSNYFLTVKLGSQEFVVPCDEVCEVLRSAPVLAIPGKHADWLGVIRAGGSLVPVVKPQTLFAGAESSSKKAEWNLVLDSKGARFSVPVDDIGGVVELPSDKIQKQPESDLD